MGSLIYGANALDVEFDDRVLAHLQVIFGQKLRRGEEFFFSWNDTPAVGDGRSALWIAKSIPLYFRYDSHNPVALNREWLEEMAISAGGNQGLFLSEEPRKREQGEPILSEDNSVKRKG